MRRDPWLAVALLVVLVLIAYGTALLILDPNVSTVVHP